MEAHLACKTMINNKSSNQLAMGLQKFLFFISFGLGRRFTHISLIYNLRHNAEMIKKPNRDSFRKEQTMHKRKIGDKIRKVSLTSQLAVTLDLTNYGCHIE